MERYMEVFTKLAFILLAIWVVLAGLGMTTMPGTRKQALRQAAARQRAARHPHSKGLMWNQGFDGAIPDEGLAYPMAQVM